MTYNLKTFNFDRLPLLLSLIVPFLIIGPFFPDLIISASSLFFYIMCLKKRF